MLQEHPSRDRNAIILWLMLCAALVACMVLIGGYTRLSGSGLSITAWKPIHGAIPPLDDAQWQEEFSAYMTSPQYLKINKGMSLDEFKGIFWPEFLHRLLGRVVGMVFFLPLLAFAWRKSLSRPLFFGLLGIFALGGLQGLVGWLMVKSGLVDMPSVSHLRLSAHLSLALAILGLIVWTCLDLLPKKTLPATPGCGKKLLWLWFALLCVQIIFGAFMAGLHAGLIYNTWPTMNGQWIPDGLVADFPWYINLTLIQFIHRKLAVFLVLAFILLWIMARKYDNYIQLKRYFFSMGALLAVQFILGVATLLYQAPLWLALAHQATGMLLFAATVVLLHRIAQDNQVKPIRNG